MDVFLRNNRLIFLLVFTFALIFSQSSVISIPISCSSSDDCVSARCINTTFLELSYGTCGIADNFYQCGDPTLISTIDCSENTSFGNCVTPLRKNSCCGGGNPGVPEICNDGKDNDADCDVDCDDADCVPSTICQKKQPTQKSASGCPVDYWISQDLLNPYCSGGDCVGIANSDGYRKEYNFLTTKKRTVESSDTSPNTWEGVCVAFAGITYNPGGDDDEYKDDVDVDLVTDVNTVNEGMVASEDDFAIPDEFSKGDICPDQKCTDTCSEDGKSVYKFFIDAARQLGDDNAAFVWVQCPNNNDCVNDVNGLIKGGRCYVCDHDAICDEFEQAAGCADCRLCNDAGRIIYNNPSATGNSPDTSALINWTATQEACQGSSPDNYQPCRFCPEPTQNGDSYSYTFPNELFVKKSASQRFACVNATNDPLNCGECGFTEGGITVNKDDAAPDKGVCYGSKPYCAVGSCIAWSAGGILDAEKKSYVESYIDSHSNANPVLYYDVVPDKLGYKSVPLDGSDVSTAYTVTQVDSSATVCSNFQHGNFEAGLGCCGDQKCRIKSGTMCHVTDLCDGSEWHQGADTKGEIFKMPNCDTPFPVANINGEFLKCIDYDKTLTTPGAEAIMDPAFKSAIGSDNYGCVYGNPTTENSAIWTEAWGYLCPSGSYMIQPMGAVRGLGYGWSGDDGETCKANPNQVEDYLNSGGYLVCAAGDQAPPNNIYGFASIIDGPLWQITQVPKSRPICPAPVYKSYISREIKAITPCPGIVQFPAITFINSNPAVALTGMGDNSRIGVVCSNDKNAAHPAVGLTNDPAEGMSELGYFKGNGTIMGNVNNHDYACFTDLSSAPAKSPDETRAFIGVCCGTQTCADLSDSVGAGGKIYQPGDSVNTTRGLAYCLDDGHWSVDLDFVDSQAACGRAGSSGKKLLATGQFCCSEGDDTSTIVNESYSDAGGSGACFKSAPQTNGKFLTYAGKSYRSVLVYNGSLRGCGFNDSLYASASSRQASCSWSSLITNDCLQGLEDWPNPGSGKDTTKTAKPAIKQAAACTLLDVANGYYCNVSGSWVDAKNENISHLSVIPPVLLAYLKNETNNQNLLTQGCCLPTQCWDPKAAVCIDAQASYDLFYKVNNATIFKCWFGGWVNVLGGEKYTPDGCVSGFCPEKSMCLFNPSGNPADNGNTDGNPQCILSGQYMGDRLCVNGSWSTRTAVVSLKLASLIKSGDDFALSCGDSSDVLFNKMNPGLTNSYCVLNLRGKRIFGTSLNQNLTGATGYGFVSAMTQSFWLSYPGSNANMDVSACNPSLSGFNRCMHATAGSKELLNLYYDKNYSIVIFSDQPVSGLTPGLVDRVCSSLPGWLKWLCPTPSSLTVDLRRSDFDRVFAAKQSSKQVLGLGKNKCDGIRKSWVYSFNYTEFGVNGLNSIIDGFGKESVVNKQGNSVSVVITNPVSASAWNDLSILRSPIV